MLSRRYLHVISFDARHSSTVKHRTTGEEPRTGLNDGGRLRQYRTNTRRRQTQRKQRHTHNIPGRVAERRLHLCPRHQGLVAARRHGNERVDAESVACVHQLHDGEVAFGVRVRHMECRLDVGSVPACKVVVPFVTSNSITPTGGRTKVLWRPVTQTVTAAASGISQARTCTKFTKSHARTYLSLIHI